jgi:hypothetical protein
VIPTYSIHQMIGPLEGGTTRPWVCLVDDGGDMPTKYVAKFFHKSDFDHANHLAAEVMGSVLCQEFDIHTPEFGFLVMHEITDVNCPSDMQERLAKNSYPQPWFGSVYSSESAEFSIALHNRYLSMDEMASIFAFDCLVHNSDRRQGKPNLLVKNEHIWAIDHDKAFAHHNPDNKYLAFYAKEHLFQARLSKYCKKNGFMIFDTFAETLKVLNLNEWNASLNQLEQLGLPFVHRTEWQNHLLGNKRNPSKFVSSLCEVLK